MRCNCQHCIDSRKWDAILARGDIGELRVLVEELRNRLADAEEDLSIKKEVLKGDWPSAYEYLTRITGRWAV